ncbi:MAG: hypothetical protein ACH36H_06290 [Candidatus Nanopelagicales bacterium]
MNIIGVRHEDKNRWERRVPLTPSAVAELVGDDGFHVRVQASDRRVFDDAAYRSAGAEVVAELDGCDVVLAVKEIPVELLGPDTAYVFFSHTIKGQPHSMPLLQHVLDVGATLIDYEPIVGADGRRLVHFGRFAGLAGMVDALWAFGRRWQARGVDTPFLRLRQAFEYDDLAQALDAVSAVGATIAAGGLPADVGPLVVGVTGYGNVGGGAGEVLDRLPRVDIAPGQLAGELVRATPSTQVLVSVFTEQDTVARDDGADFTAAEFLADPAAFHSVFAPTAGLLSILVNSVLWQPEAPRLLAVAELAELQRADGRLALIADLSCDIEGGIEATVRATTSDDPVFVFDTDADAGAGGFRRCVRRSGPAAGAEERGGRPSRPARSPVFAFG